MSLKDEFIAERPQTVNEKIRYVLNDQGHVIYVEKRVDRRLHDVYLNLKKIRCTNLPSIIDIELQGNCLIIHEEYIRGRTLEQILREEGPLNDEALLRVALDICSALLVLHGRIPPIIHRDIKPANIMWHEDGGYVLMDFDAARLYREDTNTDTTCIATVGYAAPEQYGLSQTDVRSDLFSLGATLYELKTGESYQVGAKCGGILGKVIEKCTAFEPKKRFQSARQLMDRLEKLSPERKGKNLLPAVILGAVVLAAAVIALALPKKQEIPPVVEDPPASAEVPGGRSTPVPTPAETSETAIETPSYVEGYSFHGAELYVQGGMIIPDSGASIDTWQALVIPYEGGTMTISLQVINRSYSNYEEMQPAIPIGCKMEKMDLSADGEVTEDGILTVRKPGAYFINTLAQYGDQVGGPIRAMVIVTDVPEAYTQCKCILDWEKSKPVFTGETRYVKDGGDPILLELRENCVFDNRLCEASVHKEVFHLPGYIYKAPDDADCGVTEDNHFYTYSPGEYTLRGNVVISGELTTWGAVLIVEKK